MPSVARSKTAGSSRIWNCELAAEPSASSSKASCAGSSAGSSSPASWVFRTSRSRKPRKSRTSPAITARTAVSGRLSNSALTLWKKQPPGKVSER